MNKKLMATAAAASTLGGAAAGAALLAPGQAGAQDDTDTPPAEETVRPEFGERIEAALQGLVDDGTLTETQVDAVVDALAEARPDHAGRPGPRGHHGRGLAGGADIAGILGVEPEELRDALRSGQSIADVAAEQGVDVQDVVDAIVDATEERVNDGLESGRLDQERADEILGNIEEHAEDLVNGELERPGRGFRGDPAGPAEDTDTAA